MSWRRTGRTLVELVLALTLLLGASYARAATTQVTETVYHADGSAAAGTLLVSWPSFTAADGSSVPAGSTSVTIGAGGVMSTSLVPNAGATPMGTYYTVVYHLDDGSTTREYWVVPVSAYPVQVSSIKSSVLPLSVAMQTVSKAYVDTAIATAMTGHPLDSSTPYVLKTGDTMTGPLQLPGDPTSALQASDKQYVDEQSAALTAGLGQKVSLLPSGAQTVAQPAGTALAVNDLNGELYASQYASSAGNDGIASAAAGANCASGCEVKAEPTYGASEAVAPATWNSQTHVSDARGGAVVDTYLNPENPHAGGNETAQTVHVVSTRSSADLKATEGVVEPFSYGLSVEQESLAGGSNLFPQLVQGSVPYFKTTYTALQAKGTHSTLGQHVLAGLSQTCYAVGDCLIGGQFLTSSGGFRDDGDEGTHPFDLEMAEDTRVFEGTCASGCATGSTNVQITPTANAGTQGEGRFLIDTNPAKVLTGGVLTGGTSVDPVTGGVARQPIVSFTGTSFPVSVLLETAQTIPTQASDVRPGTVTVTIATSGVPAGFQTSTAALPTASGVACVTDMAFSDQRPLNYEMAAYTTVDGSHLSLTLNKAHSTGSTIAVGGLCGYGLEQTVDTAGGIRQVFPVVASTSTTTLLYAGGSSPIVGVQSNTSAYLNVNATIASVSRSSNVVTVTTAGNLPVDVNGLTLTIAGVADSSFNGSFAVTSTGPNTLTYAQGGANGTSTGGSATVVTGGYALYPMAEVLTVFNTTTRAIDGQMTLAANTVAWTAGDTVEQPHYFQQSVLGDTEYIQQTTPRPERLVGAGVSYGGNNGPGLNGWQVTNLVPATQYLGNGGTHTTPDAAFQGIGVWKRSMSVQAGDEAAFAVHCNSHGCGRWDSTYDLFQLDSNVGIDTVQFAPTTSTLNFNLRGTQYSMSPTALTAGTIEATSINAGSITGGISAGSLPLFVASGTSHAAGAVPDPGAAAGTTRYLREDGTWTPPNGAMPTGLQCEFVYAGGSGTTWPATVGSYTTTLATGAQAPTWVQGGLAFTASTNTNATIPGGCIANAKTVMIFYTSDVGQNIAKSTHYGPIFSTDAGDFLNAPPSASSQGPGYDKDNVISLDRVTGTTAATLVFGNVQGTGFPRIFLNGNHFTSNFQAGLAYASWPAASTVYLGDYMGGTYATWGGTIHAIAAWSTYLTPAQVQQAYELIDAGLKPYGVHAADRTDYSRGVVTIDGDSITEAVVGNYDYGNGICNQAMDSLGSDLSYYCLGHFGFTMAELVNEFPGKVGSVLSLYSSSYRAGLVAAGTNDINTATSNASILASATTYCGLLSAAGTKCGLSTVLPAARNTSAMETQRQALNASYRSGVLDGSLGAVSLSDWAMDPVMGNVNTVGNTTYYIDTLHPAPGGAQILARYHALAVHRMLQGNTPYWLKVNVNSLAFAGINSGSYTMPLLQLLPKEKVCGVTARVNTAVAGTGLTGLTATVGNSLGSATTYGASFNAMAAGVEDNGLPATSPTETGVVQANWTATGANLSAASAGSVDFDICVVTQP